MVPGSRCLVPGTGSLPWYLVLNPERCQTGIKWCQEIEVLTVCLARHVRLLMVPWGHMYHKKTKHIHRLFSHIESSDTTVDYQSPGPGKHLPGGTRVRVPLVAGTRYRYPHLKQRGSRM